jgi:[acyl-carrier-protein] S-malonyltransferase
MVSRPKPDLAFVFPGQASQRQGMAARLIAEEPAAAALFQQAGDLLDMDLGGLCTTGSDEQLTPTQVAQPALFVTSAAWLVVLQERGLAPRMAAGHSVGEFGAWVAAGALEFRDALRLVKTRGELMAQASRRNPGTMLAVVGLPQSRVSEICDQAGRAGVVVVANMNSPQQIVVSGEVAALENVAQAVRRDRGRAIPLRVSGAFHSPLMGDASGAFAAAVSQVEVKPPRIPVIANATAEPVAAAEQARDAMVRQMTSPVLWTESVLRMVAEGVRTFVEVGPGQVLTKLVLRIAPEVRTIPVEQAEALEVLAEEAAP